MPGVHVDGVPATKGSLRRGKGGGLFADNPGLESWVAKVGAAVRNRRYAQPVSREPIELELRFTLTRPAGHLKADGTLRASARPWPTVKPDIDKLERAVLDALTGLLFHDDAQVVACSSVKVYGPTAGLDVRWRELGEGAEPTTYRTLHERTGVL